MQLDFPSLAPPHETTPKYKIEIPDQIIAEITCSGQVANSSGVGKSLVTAILGWSLKLEESDKKSLIEGGTVDKNISVYITRSSDKQNLWPLKKGQANEKLDVKVNSSAKKITINLSENPDWRSFTSNIFFGTVGQTSTLSCNDSSLKFINNGESRLYGNNMRWDGRQWTADNIEKLKVSISMDQEQCKPTERGKSTQCPLKVMTGNHLDWSDKVDKKATITLE